uniref:CBS domain-containing protein n=2 Tax=Lotharella globosa TaxID=91324 RepID=A0A7S3YCD8_9EUKA|eukprot:CAMPEP_0167777372 /NCGR_PEP_ID=MMETSP0111_2-20121227/3659_1 /TAXON_ID=91324 /ORGANISM="Lotharella globosa, Strain CCCM811" /LENGTH=376 /DNA_ID=CAMNT_0007667553 /DNA_START=83 /DNA_END=1213 /DNA_ORIENTATION=+
MTTISPKRKENENANVVSSSSSKKLKTQNGAKKFPLGSNAATAGNYPVGPNFLHSLFKGNAGRFGLDTLGGVIYCCQRDMKALDVWAAMVEKGVQSIPVMLKNDYHKYYGIIDVQDVLNFILTHLGDKASEEKKTLAELSKGVVKLERGLVKDVMVHPLSRKNPFHPVCANHSVLSVIELLAKEPHLHRVPVLDNLQERKLVNLITQSHVLDFLVKNLNVLGERAKKPVRECREFFKDVHTCNENDTTVSAFRKMAEFKVSGLAIVDDTGRLKGALSCRDVRVLGKDLHFFWRMNQTVHNFVRKLRNMSDTTEEASSEEHRPRTIVKCIPSDTLGDVITKLHKFKLHKIYLVDTPSDRKLKGVVSLRDVLKECLKL